MNAFHEPQQTHTLDTHGLLGFALLTANLRQFFARIVSALPAQPISSTPQHEPALSHSKAQVWESPAIRFRSWRATIYVGYAVTRSLRVKPAMTQYFVDKSNIESTTIAGRVFITPFTDARVR